MFRAYPRFDFIDDLQAARDRAFADTGAGDELAIFALDPVQVALEIANDDQVVDEDDKRLPQLAEGEKAKKLSVDPEQHFTQPPPRYTEATLVKKMEELGIGRPSTYASTMAVLEDRGYVRVDKKRLVPEDTGRLVTAFLKQTRSER